MAAFCLLPVDPAAAQPFTRGGDPAISTTVVWRSGRRNQSEFDLLGDAESVIDFDLQVANRAFELRVPEQQLDRSQIAGSKLRTWHSRATIGDKVEAAYRRGDLFPKRRQMMEEHRPEEGYARND